MDKQKGADMEIHTCTRKQTDTLNSLPKAEAGVIILPGVADVAIGMEGCFFPVRVTVLAHCGLPAYFVCFTHYTP